MRFALYLTLVLRIANAFQPNEQHHDFVNEPHSSQEVSKNISVSLQEFRDDGPRPLHCIRSWVIYDSSTAAAVDIRTTNVLRTWLDSTILTLGTADVFTSIDGIPVARGSFTPTRTQTKAVLQTMLSISRQTITTGTWPERTPSCRRIYHPQRSSICDVYLSSRGMRRDGYSVRLPTKRYDSFACPLPYTSCSYDSQLSPGCLLGGGKAYLFFFPELPSGILPPGQELDTRFGASHSYGSGITLTYPSVYLSFDHTSTVCTFCNYGNCGVTSIGPQTSTTMTDAIRTGRIIAVPSDLLSSIIRNTLLALEESTRSKLESSRVASPDSLVTLPVELEDLSLPPPSAYYRNAIGAPGCGTWLDQGANISGVECSTIFKDLYRPYIAAPDAWTPLRQEWEICRMTSAFAATPIALSRVTYYTAGPPVIARRPAPSADPTTSCLWVPKKHGRGRTCSPVQKREATARPAFQGVPKTVGIEFTFSTSMHTPSPVQFAAPPFESESTLTKPLHTWSNHTRTALPVALACPVVDIPWVQLACGLIPKVKNAPHPVKPVKNPASPSHYNARHARGDIATSIDTASEPGATSSLGTSTLSGQSLSPPSAHTSRDDMVPHNVRAVTQAPSFKKKAHLILPADGPQGQRFAEGAGMTNDPGLELLKESPCDSTQDKVECKQSNGVDAMQPGDQDPDHPVPKMKSDAPHLNSLDWVVLWTSVVPVGLILLML